MTPIEIFEYKVKWMKNSPHRVAIDEFLEYSAKRWCRQNVQPHKWSFSKYTDVYEDTIYFEDESDKARFEKEFRP